MSQSSDSGIHPIDRRDAVEFVALELGNGSTVEELQRMVATKWPYAVDESEYSRIVEDGVLLHSRAGLDQEAVDALSDDHVSDDDHHLAAVPEYPVAAVPEPLRGLIEAADPLPAPYVAAGGLAALAYAARVARCAVSDSWIESPALWMAALGPASSGKSPGMKFGWPPIWERERELRESWEAAMATWKAMPPKMRDEPPAHETAVLSDATVEALLRRLAESGPQIVVIDELRIWLGGLGRYGSGASGQKEIGTYLSCWDANTPINYDRVGGGISITANRPATSIIGTLQAEDHRLLGAVETGFRARWLPHLHLEAPGEEIAGAVPSTWTETLTRLAKDPPQVDLTLRGDARDVWQDAGRRWKSEASDASPGLRAAGLKAERQALRVATCLAIGMGSTSSISEQAMLGATAIIDYSLDCWRALPEGEELVLSPTEGRISTAVDKLAAWLEQRPDRQATRDQILRCGPGGIRRASVLDATLTQYEETYPGSVTEGSSSSRGGRRGVLVRAPRRTRTHAGVPSHARERRHVSENGSESESPSTSKPCEGTARELDPPDTAASELDSASELEQKGAAKV